ncbi:MAG: ribosome biogenesis GTPase Der [Thermanaeromonas sp.]|uniref:ribosome biogenesis GTPase Der n=1 Tax=Thermanaeromonas sp. TaxID=2003697 RepID=UPI002439A603|nr:ribosome biogenesis GTPase Der [Thermanaeromonas sp.]MCG0278018.1 ribosome biogenesis GTPase Der [Thermanaeromonas sp.]
MTKPVVAIIGRPNVGKSTLFNRLVGGQVAIVEDIPGITRDRLYRDTEWRGYEFTLVDTGGITEGPGGLEAAVRRQAEQAVQEADVVLFLVDAQEGLTTGDFAVAEILRRAGRPVILVANKVEDFTDLSPLAEFYRLGLGEPLPVSAAHGMNTGDLLDRVVELLPRRVEGEGRGGTRVAIVGRPNVGKSSLVNRILGEERVIVSEIPGTTRDAVDTHFKKDDKEYILIDTAGIRRKARITDATERFSVQRALRAVDRADVVLVVLDATEGVTKQDKRIAGYGHDKGKASIIIVNKWDLVPKNDKTLDLYRKAVLYELGFMDYAPVLFVSALTGQRVHQVLPLVDEVAAEARKRVPTSTLNTVVQEAVFLMPPPAKIYYATQVGVQPPTVVFFTSDPEAINSSYERYLENRLRQAFGFKGTPLKLIFRESKGGRAR